MVQFNRNFFDETVWTIENERFRPRFTITPTIVRLVSELSAVIGRLSAQADTAKTLRLRRINRIRTIQGSLAIEGNTLSEEQVSAILDGKRVIAQPREVQEIRIRREGKRCL